MPGSPAHAASGAPNAHTQITVNALTAPAISKASTQTSQASASTSGSTIASS